MATSSSFSRNSMEHLPARSAPDATGVLVRRLLPASSRTHEDKRPGENRSTLAIFHDRFGLFSFCSLCFFCLFFSATLFSSVIPTAWRLGLSTMGRLWNRTWATLGFWQTLAGLYHSTAIGRLPSSSGFGFGGHFIFHLVGLIFYISFSLVGVHSRAQPCAIFLQGGNGKRQGDERRHGRIGKDGRV